VLNADIFAVHFSPSYIWLMLLIVSIKMHSYLYFMIECCCMYVFSVVHNKSSYIYVFISMDNLMS
jgi:hypothetical protein